MRQLDRQNDTDSDSDKMKEVTYLGSYSVVAFCIPDCGYTRSRKKESMESYGDAQKARNRRNRLV